jgi:hypothetical protein
MLRFFFLLILLFGIALGQITNVNLGTTANDGTGDSARKAFGKINTNVAWLASQLGSATNSILSLSNSAAFSASSVSTTGLAVTVTGGNIFDRAGNPIQIGNATSIPLRASSTNYIVANLWDGSVHNFRRSIGDGEVLLSVIVTDSASVTSKKVPSTIRVPESAVSRTKAKIASGAPINVLVLGTSIMSYATSTSAGNVGFVPLLFSTTPTNTLYRVNNAASTTLSRYDHGSTAARLSFSLLGKAISNPTFTTSAGALGLSYGPGGAATLASVASTNVAVLDSWIATEPDVAVMDFYNPATYLLPYIEQCVRRMREAGIEVVLIANGPNQSDNTYRWDDGLKLWRIAKAHGCALMDSASYFRERVDLYSDTSIWADGVHPSQYGNEILARSLRGVFNDIIQDKAAPMFSRGNVSLAEVTAADQGWFPEISENIVRFAAESGTSWGGSAATAATAAKNPQVLQSLKPTTNCLTSIPPSGYVQFGHPLMISADMYVEYEPNTNNSISLTSNNGGTSLKTLSWSVSSGSYPAAQPQVVELLNAAEVRSTYTSSLRTRWYGDGSTLGGFGNAVLRITNTGTNRIQLHAVSIHTLKNREVMPNEWKRNATGTWVEESSVWTSTVTTLGNDTTGAEAFLQYYGRGILVVLQASESSGIVSVLHDGVVTPTLDCYLAPGSTPYYYYLAAPQVVQASGDWQVASKNHSVSVRLTGANGSVTTAATGRRRMTIVRAYVIE